MKRFVSMSYVKTLAALVVLSVVALLFAVISQNWPLHLAPIVLLDELFALITVIFVCAGVIVLVRYRRSVLGETDLFLELNRSRSPAAITAAPPARTTRLRRWLGRHLLGHDLVVGDLVEVKAWSEIRATLDERGCLEHLPFMPEMLKMCGQHMRVFRCIHRIFDYRKSRRMRHMDGAVLLVGTLCDGSSHGGCEALCHTIWKSAWLRRVESSENTAGAQVSADRSGPPIAAPVLRFGTQAPCYACQLTQLHAASRPIGNWSVINFLRPLISGNVASAAFVVGWLTYLFNELQHWRGGVGFPVFGVAIQDGRKCDETQLAVGDHVVVRSSSEIRATLNDQFLNRGLYFDEDMLKHCGHRYCIRAVVTQLIDIVTGEMRKMKTPAYILRDVHFSGERQLFNAQYEPLFWRGVWLRQDEN